MPDVLSFPGRSLHAGDDRRELVTQLQNRLNDVGSGPLPVDGAFGSRTRTAVTLFQARRGLVVDGTVGPATWDELFGAGVGSPPVAPAPLPLAAVKLAGGEVGVRESGGPNRGPRVDEYLRNVGLDPTRGSYSWCASFVYFCFNRAAQNLGIRNPCVKTAGVMNHWRLAPAWARVTAQDLAGSPSAVRPGAIFVIDHGQGKGHTGLVERVSPGSLHTIEGNTNTAGSREGDGVYRRIRPLASILPGFIDYGLPHPS
jgi:hypothetical protein